jgi:hypothetical protein
MTAADPLGDIFSREALERLANTSQTEELALRLRVITGRGLVSGSMRERQKQFLEAQRSAWSDYVNAAHACGLFEEPHGADLVSRLRGVDDENFRSAIAECQGAWYLGRKLGLEVSARPVGKGSSELEFLLKLPDGEVHVEVKSPLREAISAGSVDDSDILDRCLADASRQFKKETRNLLMLVGRLTLGVSIRRFFVKAFYADQRWEIVRETSEFRTEFDPTGRFLKVWPGEAGPRHTRVSGVLYVEENIRSHDLGDGSWNFRAEHDALMMHNPSALHSLPEESWGDCPQLVSRGDVMQWTDGHAV